MHTAGLLLYLSTVTSATPLLRSEGVASLADGTVAYREVHWRRGAPEGAARWVQYLCPDGRPFARKELPGTTQPQARGYLLQDGRSGQAARVVVAGGQVSIDWKESAPDAERRAQVPLPADAVIDTGFDAAVRAHWPALLKGDEVRLPFLVPGRQRFYPVSVRRTGALTWQGVPAQAIEVRLATWYGAVTPRLSLVYADDDRRLLEFRGPSNLRDAHGAYPAVIVRFAPPGTTQPQSRWQQAWAEPLVASCGVSSR